MSRANHQLVLAAAAWLALTGAIGCYRQVGTKAEWTEEHVLAKRLEHSSRPSAHFEGDALVVGRARSCRAVVSTESQNVAVAQLKRGDGDVVLGTLGAVGFGLVAGGAAWAIVNAREGDSPVPGLALGGGGLAVALPTVIVAGVLAGMPLNIERRLETSATKRERMDGLPEPCGAPAGEAPHDSVFAVTYRDHPDAVTWSGRTADDGRYGEPALSLARAAVGECGSGTLSVFIKEGEDEPTLLGSLDLEPLAAPPLAREDIGARPELLSLGRECCARRRAIAHEESCLDACGAAMDAQPCVGGYAQCVEAVTSELDASVEGAGFSHCRKLRDECFEKRSGTWDSVTECAAQCSVVKGRTECKQHGG